MFEQGYHKQGLQAHDIQEEPHLNKRFRKIVLPTGEKSTLLPHNTGKLMDVAMLREIHVSIQSL